MNGNNTKEQNGHSASNHETYGTFPANVGLLAMEVYFPVQYVDQNKLEEFDNVSAGKYTIGLGQSKMSFCLDNEDINSICLTALNNLMEKYNIKPNEIGRLDVGTETLVDKSKSVKSTLMKLFEESGNSDVEGIDNVNACFGGTAALFNAINWIESSYWDGRYAAVVMGDIAVYAKGNARPTGGAGAVALLVGPNASLVFERGMRSLHVAHAYDFYKPVMDSEYPVVDGKLSVACYLNALDKCYQGYKRKQAIVAKRTAGTVSSDHNNNHLLLPKKNQSGFSFSLNSADTFLFHSPYCKLVQKSFARLLWNDYLDETNNIDKKTLQTLEKFKQLSNEETLSDKQLEKELVHLSDSLFKTKTNSSLLFSKEIGNMYTPSLYGCLASYLSSFSSTEELSGKRICLFSYGSGLASAMFSLVVCDDSPAIEHRFSLERIVANLKSLKQRLADSRVEIEPSLYDAYLQQRELTHKKAPRECFTNTDTLYPGTWYLKSIDSNYRRSYERYHQNNQIDLERARSILISNLSSIQL